MSSLMRRTIDTLLPKGSAWSPKPGGGFDNFLNGLAANWETIRLFLTDLKNVRNPHSTSFLADLEREYGIVTNLSLTEEQRRAALSPLVYNRSSTGSVDAMQQALTDAGFDVTVYENSPAVDPALFLDQAFQMVADGGAAFAGNEDAFAGRVGGELLVNGDIFKTTKAYEVVAGNLYAGDGQTAGEYTDIIREKIEYDIPIDPGDWPLVFFVGGDVTRGIIDLIFNGDFELGNFGGWVQNGSTIDSVNPASGTYCSKLEAVGIEISGAATDDYDIVNSNAEYILKFKNDVSAITSGAFVSVLEFIDSLDVVIASKAVTKSAVTSGYESIELKSGVDFNMPPSTSKIRFSSRWELQETPWDLSTATYDSVSKSVNSEDTAPQGIFFKSDGTKMYMLGAGFDSVYQYSLSTPWDLSTATYDSVSKSVNSEDTTPQGIFFKSDGTKMYMVGSGFDSVYQYSLSTPWDLSTATYDSVSKSVNSEDTTPQGIFFKSDGTKMYMLGSGSNSVYQYSLESADGTAYIDDVEFYRTDESIISIESASIQIEQESDFKRIILKYKPIHSWAGLIVTYT